EHQRRFTSLDDFDHAAGLQILGDEFVHAARRGAIPPAGPVASAADDVDDAARIRSIEPARVLHQRSDALVAFREEIAEVMRNLSRENIADRLEGTLGE